MISPEEVLRIVMAALEQADIPYMVVGSIASGVYGEFRASNDMDIVVSPTPLKTRFLIRLLGEAFVADLDSALDALRRRGMFSVIHYESCWKVDLIVCKDHPHSQLEMRRSRRVSVAGLEMCLPSPEDVILSKLAWCKQSDPERQFRDAFGVATIQWNDLDMPYLNEWAQKLDVADLWAQIQDQVRELQEDDKA